MLYKFKCAVARFMYGRNGVDQLGQAMLIAYLILWGLETVLVAVTKSSLLASVGNTVMTALSLVLLFRMFSKNLPKRRGENQAWVNWWWKVKNRGAGAKARHADKDHKYFTCKTCGAICRVPVGKGKVVITCPKCGNHIEGKT